MYQLARDAVLDVQVRPSGYAEDARGQEVSETLLGHQKAEPLGGQRRQERQCQHCELARLDEQRPEHEAKRDHQRHEERALGDRDRHVFARPRDVAQPVGAVVVQCHGAPDVARDPAVHNRGVHRLHDVSGQHAVALLHA